MAESKCIRAQTEIKCDAETMFNIWARNTSEITKICPDKFHCIQLVHGACIGAVGAILKWTYCSPADGKQEYVKTKLIKINEKKRSFTYELTEGDILNKYYRTWRQKIEITPKSCGNGSVVKCSIVEVEKTCGENRDPNIYLNFFIDSIKQTDRHFSCRKPHRC